MQSRQIVEGYTGIQMVLKMIADIVGGEEKSLQWIGVDGSGRTEQMVVAKFAKVFSHRADVLEHEKSGEIGHNPIDGKFRPDTQPGDQTEEDYIKQEPWEFLRERQIAFAIGFAATKAFEEPDCIADASPEAEVGKHNQQEFPTGFGNVNSFLPSFTNQSGSSSVLR